MAERLLFVTGKLAAPALRDTLGRAELPFDYEIAVLKITVAALMTTEWIARFLEPPDAVSPRRTSSARLSCTARSVTQV